MIEEIIYTEENKKLFDEFNKPVTIRDIELFKDYPLYRDDIKTFHKNHVNIDINIYFTKHYNGKNFFYIIEGNTWFITSDEIEDMDILTYEGALNRAIKYIFTKILNNK